MFYNTSSKKVIARTIHLQNFLWEEFGEPLGKLL